MSVQNAESFAISVEAFLKDGFRNPMELDKWIKLCSKNIKILNAASKQGANIGVKQHLLAVVGRLMGSRTVLKAMVIRGGAHKINHPNSKSWSRNRVKWEDAKSIFGGRMRTGIITNLGHKDPLGFLEDCGQLFVRRISNSLKTEHFLKINAGFCGKFTKPSANEEIEDFKFLRTKFEVVSRDTNLCEWFAENVLVKIMEQLEEFQERDSGWALSAVVNLTVSINKYTPQLGSSYVKLPNFIKRKQACINIQNSDEFCFAWAVTSALFPKAHGENPTRPSSYPHYSKVLKLDGITFPVTREGIRKFEKNNNISVNVYKLSKKKTTFSVSPSRLTDTKRDTHVNLLLIQEAYYDEDEEVVEKKPSKYHYVWIKNLSRLISKQLSKHNGEKYICDRCLHYFQNEERLKSHVINCEMINNYKVVFPEKGNIKFEHFKNKERCPFVVYADFESILKPVNKKMGNNSNKFQQHEAHSVAFYLKCSYDDSLSRYDSYRGQNCAEWFCDELNQLAVDVESVLSNPLSMDKLTDEQEILFSQTSACHICEKHLGCKRVRDHCHLTGKYRGPAHESCNLLYKDSHTIPVIFHNFSGYDSHLLIRDVALKISGNLSLIPNNSENFISFSKYIMSSKLIFKFIDSYRFMSSSLGALSSHLEEKPILASQFPNLNEELLELLTRKGVFPYDHVKNWESLEEKQLPKRIHFYSKLTDSDISDEDYAHAQKVWEMFKIQTLGDYSDLYLKTDVLLLADIFEAFRDVCLKNYGLDPAHYYTAPGLSWDAMLKCTGQELEYIVDVDMLMFLERGIRGGLTQCSKRYAQANNKYADNYNPKKPSKYLMYYDINAMYAWAMSQCLPYGNLKWLEGDVSQFSFEKPDDGPIGYILEVDMEYPENIHNRHRDLPLAPNKGTPPGSKQQKMLATLFDKKNYIVHYRNLKQYVAEGLYVRKIHRVLQFSQSPWLRKYIEINAELRKHSKNEFEKNFFKLMNNAVFGKTMENVRNRRDIKLISMWQGRYGSEARISKPNFHSSKIIDDDLVLIEMLKTEVMFNKPVYVGMAILDISKILLYDFHYSYMTFKYGEKASLCYTDTDSLLYEIETEDVYADMKENLHRFDTSEYDRHNPYDIPLVNKKIPGKMKDEAHGHILTEFVGLRAKMYACRIPTGKKPSIKKAKGVKSYVVKSQITFDDYKQCLDENLEVTHPQSTIRSLDHILYSVTQKKVSLSPYDNKRCLIPGSYDTLPWGHFSIMDTS